MSSKSIKRRQKPKPQAMAIHRGLTTLFPEHLITRLKFTAYSGITTTAGFATFGTEITYRLASLFDPVFALGGNQPFGFDQITPWYMNYQVKAANIKVTFYDPTEEGIIVGILVKNWADSNTLQSSSIPRAMEMTTCKTGDIPSTGSQRRVITYNVDIAKFMGLSPATFDASFATTGAVVTDNPAQTPYLSIACADSRFAASAKSVAYNLEIEYVAHFFQRRQPPSS